MSEHLTLGEIVERVRTFLVENYVFGYDENEFTNDSSFMEFGVLDSTGIMELLAFIETEFQIEVLDAEILPENMDSINCVSQMVARKLDIPEMGR